MQVNNQTRPVTMTIPAKLIEKIDKLSGPDRRSHFVTRILHEYIAAYETQANQNEIVVSNRQIVFDAWKQQTS